MCIKEFTFGVNSRNYDSGRIYRYEYKLTLYYVYGKNGMGEYTPSLFKKHFKILE